MRSNSDLDTAILAALVGQRYPSTAYSIARYLIEHEGRVQRALHRMEVEEGKVRGYFAGTEWAYRLRVDGMRYLVIKGDPPEDRLGAGAIILPAKSEFGYAIIEVPEAHVRWQAAQLAGINLIVGRCPFSGLATEAIAWAMIEELQAHDRQIVDLRIAPQSVVVEGLDS